MEHKIVIFTDIGDTVINEGTEVRKVPCGVVYDAQCIPGARETMLTLYDRGYTIVMVADGLVESFDNLMRINGLSHIFAARSISEEHGVEKPDQIMFQSALERAGLTDADKGRIIMVGNNLKRDIVGANRFGITSVFLDWTDRYPKEPETEEETPRYRIHKPEELLTLVEQLERTL